MRNRLHITIAALAAAVCAFAISSQVSSGETTSVASGEQSGADALPAARPAPTTVAPAIAARYAIFRRAASSSDAALVRKDSFAARQQGIAVDGARLISSPTAAWRASVVPSAGGACIFVLTPDMAGPGGGCGTQDEVQAGLLTTSVADIAVGLVPDDVNTAAITYDDGASQTVPILNNAYSLKLAKPARSLSYTSSSIGKITVPLG